MSHTCRICGREGDHPTYRVAEQMFQLGDIFEYFQCGECGCLQIVQAPSQWERYYPRTYYSFNLIPLPRTGLRARVGGWRDRAYVRGPDWLASWLAALKPPGFPSLRPLQPDFSTRILDVGCGSGQLLSALQRAGYRHLLGVDPFIERDLSPAPGVQVLRRTLQETAGQFDLIMLHHVLEHVEDGSALLIASREHLAPNGKILVRIPLGEGEVWRRYRERAVHLDAPRHYCLHTRTSFERLTDQAGLRIEGIRYDSGPDQFWASELYTRGHALMEAGGQVVDPRKHFSSRELAAFTRAARRCNQSKDGNQFAAVLVAKSEDNRDGPRRT